MKPAKHLNLLILLAVFTATASSVSEAGEPYYRWNDKWGNPVLSDRLPPKGTDYEVVNSKSSLARRVNLAEDVVPAKVEPPVEKKVEKIDNDTVIIVPDKDPMLCERAKSNLNALSTRARVRVKNDQGEYHFLTDEEKETKQSESHDQIEAYCE